jgi:hypothetical protein
MPEIRQDSKERLGGFISNSSIDIFSPVLAANREVLLAVVSNYGFVELRASRSKLTLNIPTLLFEMNPRAVFGFLRISA